MGRGTFVSAVPAARPAPADERVLASPMPWSALLPGERRDQWMGGHDGGQSGTSTNLLILRDKEIVVSVLCNLYNASEPVGNITWSLAAIADGREPKRAQAR